MEQWSFLNYKNPFLDIHDVHVLNQSSLLVIADANEFIVELDAEKVNLDQIKQRLMNLRDPSSALWADLKNLSTTDGALLTVLSSLDEHDVLLQSNNAYPLEEAFVRLEAIVQQTVSLIENHLSINLMETFPTHLQILLQAVEGELHKRVQIREILPIIAMTTKFEQPWIHQANNNFYLKTLLYQIEYLKIAHPLALLTWFMTLYQLARQFNISIKHDLNEIADRWRILAQDELGGLYCQASIEHYQYCLAMNLLDSLNEKAICRFNRLDWEAKFNRPMSGANFIVQIERLITLALDQQGESILLERLRGAKEQNLPLISGLFIELFHVNRRFVEILTPLLHKRLNKPLSARLFKYFEEEYGHEEFEYQTCQSLTISKDMLENACPLPLIQAYVDAFTVVAKENPLGFFASAMITEGLLGQPSELYDHLETSLTENKAFQAAARNHDNLNIDFNHTSLSRLFLVEIDYISTEAQYRAIQHLLFLLELNQRALEQIVAFYADQQTFVYHAGLMPKGNSNG